MDKAFLESSFPHSEGGNTFLKELMSDTLLCVQDPFDHCQNLCQNVSRQTIISFKQYLNQAAWTLQPNIQGEKGFIGGIHEIMTMKIENTREKRLDMLEGMEGNQSGMWTPNRMKKRIAIINPFTWLEVVVDKTSEEESKASASTGQVVQAPSTLIKLEIPFFPNCSLRPV